MADIDEANFREAAKEAVRKHLDNGDIVAGLVWARIIGLYEKALEAASKTTES